MTIPNDALRNLACTSSHMLGKAGHHCRGCYGMRSAPGQVLRKVAVGGASAQQGLQHFQHPGAWVWTICLCMCKAAARQTSMADPQNAEPNKLTPLLEHHDLLLAATTDLIEYIFPVKDDVFARFQTWSCMGWTCLYSD